MGFGEGGYQAVEDGGDVFEQLLDWLCIYLGLRSFAV